MKKLRPQDTDVLLKLMQVADTPANLDASQYIFFQFDFRDYEQFILECPPGSIRFNNFLRVAVFCDNLGVLVDGGAIEPEVVFEVYAIPWTKMEPIIQGMRRELGWPDLFDYFERLGKQYQKWWEPKAKKIKLPEPPKAEGPRPALRPVARPTLVQATRFARPGTALATRPGARVMPAARPALATRPGARVMPAARPAAAKPAAKPSRPVSPPKRAAKPKKAAKPARKGKKR
ncbi:MAG: DUF4760 domain-containing protein [bacterium]